MTHTRICWKWSWNVILSPFFFSLLRKYFSDEEAWRMRENFFCVFKNLISWEGKGNFCGPSVKFGIFLKINNVAILWLLSSVSLRNFFEDKRFPFCVSSPELFPATLRDFFQGFKKFPFCGRFSFPIYTYFVINSWGRN